MADFDPPVPRLPSGPGGSMAVIAAVVVAVGFALLPAPAGLPPAGLRAAGIFAACLILWVTEAVPIAVTALLAVALQPVAGIASAPAAFSAFMSPVFFFVLAMFAIALAFSTTGLARRFACWLLVRAGGSPRRTIGLFMAGTAALSTVVSDVPCAAVFMAIALGLFERLGLGRGSPFARALMIGIPIASLIGGVATPAGSSVNLLGLFLLEKYGQVHVSFLEWTAVGLPMVVVLVPIAAWAVIWCHPPEMDRIDGIDFQADLAALGPLSRPERRLLVIGLTMLAFWLASSWYPAIDTSVVAVLGAVALFLPGVGIFQSWKEVEGRTAWDSLLMIGGVTSLGAASANSGLATWIVDLTMGGVEGWPAAPLIAAISLFIVLVHLAVPVNPAIVAAIVPPVAQLAIATGQNPALYALPVVFTASCAFLLPLDAVPLVTYGLGYYRPVDMFRPGALVSLAWVLLMTAAMLVVGPWVGWL